MSTARAPRPGQSQTDEQREGTASADVNPNFRVQVQCSCGCGKFGAPKGKLGHPKGCTCKSCSNGRNSRAGKRAQVPAARALGAQRTSTLKPGNEETLPTVIRFESKSAALAHPVHTFYDRTRAQSDAGKSIGDVRPFAATAQRDGRTLAVIDIKDLPQIVWLLGENYGWGPSA